MVADASPAPAPTRKKKEVRHRPILTFDASDTEVRQVAPAPAAVEQVSLKLAAHDGAPGPAGGAVRRAYVDLTAQPWFGRADDHSWLSGQVLYSTSTNTWRLHYASVDDNDAYGGTVTLLAGDQLKGLKDGQSVRVHGRPIDPDRREAGSPYRVASFEVIEHPH
jgi:hypothetical protein